jgi:UDPglucose--hexose-1-phosphate uridylyltransferase
MSRRPIELLDYCYLDYLSVSKFRQNPISKDWTIIATGRKKRPVAVGFKSVKSASSTAERCPFCVGNEDLAPVEIHRLPMGTTDNDQWQVRVIPNKYPITDFHEVIIHSPDHEKDIDELPLKQVELILRTYKDRCNFYKDKRSDLYVHIYNNVGKEAGASIKHPHSQLVVFNQIPEEIAEEIAGAEDFFERKGLCPYCDLIRKELSSKERLVLESDLFVVLTPFESEWPYEITVFPKEHQADFGEISDKELLDLASVLQQTLQAYNKTLSHPDRNFWIHSLPVGVQPPATCYYHWHLNLIPRIKTLGGLELGAGIMVDDRVGPEQAARELREALG